jgi:glycosyltransferase involved in cell wall biosynthesis
MCQALQAQGVNTLIATTDSDGSGHLPVNLEQPLAYKDVPTIFFPRQWSEAFMYSHRLARWLEGNIKTFDLVHIHAIFSHSSLVAARICQRHNVPYVLRPLGSLDPWSLSQKHFRKRLLLYTGAERMVRKAAAVHYTTAEERRLAESRLGLNRGVVIPLGINAELLQVPADPETFRQHHPSLADNPYVLVLSRLHTKKGLELLLDVFLNVTSEKELKHWRLVLAGDGEIGYVTSLKRLVEKREGEGRVLFTGWLDESQKASALQGAALLALLSRQENFGLSVAEALACGVPVLVSTQVNLAEEIHAAGAGWVVGLKPAALAPTLAEALCGDTERARRGKAGRELASSRFMWTTIAAELVELYRSVTNRATWSESSGRGVVQKMREYKYN